MIVWTQIDCLSLLLLLTFSSAYLRFVTNTKHSSIFCLDIDFISSEQDSQDRLPLPFSSSKVSFGRSPESHLLVSLRTFLSHIIWKPRLVISLIIGEKVQLMNIFWLKMLNKEKFSSKIEIKHLTLTM